jgi:hypothetical protein
MAISNSTSWVEDAVKIFRVFTAMAEVSSSKARVPSGCTVAERDSSAVTVSPSGGVKRVGVI